MIGTEVWKPIPGRGRHYMASSIGRIKTLARTVRKRNQHGSISVQVYKERILSPSTRDSYGHKVVHLGYNGKKETAAVHRLVLEAFVGTCPAGMEGCHFDGDASNNSISNLRWDTHYNNNQDRVRHGTYPSGDSHPMAKISNAMAREILNDKRSVSELSSFYGISKTQVYRIKNYDRGGL